MARHSQIKFGRRRTPNAGEVHPMQLGRITVRGRKAEIPLQHVGQAMKGKRLVLEEEMPADPDGLLGSLFRACGIEVGEEMTFDQRKLEGQVVNAVFGQSLDGEVEIVEFNPWKEVLNGPDA